MGTPLVSIIVPCYNQGLYIAETLNSVLQQCFLDWECVIMDDGSTDNSAEIIQSFCDKDSRFVYFKQNNSGVCITRNNAIKHSRGKYILPLDADDIIEPDYLEMAVNVFENKTDVKVVNCLADQFGEHCGSWFLPEYSFNELLWNNTLICASMFRRSDFDKTIGYNPNMEMGCEDWDFWLSLLGPNDVVYRIGEVLFHYRVRLVSRSTDAAKAHKLIYRQIVRNHMDYYEEYIDNLIPMRNQLYWANVWKDSYYRHSLARFKDWLFNLKSAITKH